MFATLFPSTSRSRHRTFGEPPFGGEKSNTALSFVRPKLRSSERQPHRFNQPRRTQKVVARRP